MSVNITTPLQVLVVEDSLVNRTLLQYWLGDIGAQVLLATNLAEARQLLTQYQPTHLIIDLQLPDGSGLSLHQDQRVNQPGRWIACTVPDDEDHIQALRAAGFDDILVKPLALAQLIEVINRVSEPVEPNAASAPPTTFLVPVLDYESALHRLGDDAELMAELADSFLAEWGTLPEQLRGAWHTADRKLLARMAHTVGGLSGQFGLLALQHRLRLLEGLSVDPQSPAGSIDAVIAAVVSAFQLAIPALRVKLSSKECY
ncbi:response regulator [Chitinimonas naiadis]